jgi:hypothetical protein
VEAPRYGLKFVDTGSHADLPIQRKKNGTGLPHHLKSGIESLSGISMDNVNVHYSSPQPAQLNALAYARGSDIHIAPGQERHLSHEAWHVVQQAQGRVKPTKQMKGRLPINDDARLEQEADAMGMRAMQMRVRGQGAADPDAADCVAAQGMSMAGPAPAVQRLDQEDKAFTGKFENNSGTVPLPQQGLSSSLNVSLQRQVLSQPDHPAEREVDRAGLDEAAGRRVTVREALATTIQLTNGDDPAGTPKTAEDLVKEGERKKEELDQYEDAKKQAGKQVKLFAGKKVQRAAILIEGLNRNPDEPVEEKVLVKAREILKKQDSATQELLTKNAQTILDKSGNGEALKKAKKTLEKEVNKYTGPFAKAGNLVVAPVGKLVTSAFGDGGSGHTTTGESVGGGITGWAQTGSNLLNLIPNLVKSAETVNEAFTNYKQGTLSRYDLQKVIDAQGQVLNNCAGTARSIMKGLDAVGASELTGAIPIVGIVACSISLGFALIDSAFNYVAIWRERYSRIEARENQRQELADVHKALLRPLVYKLAGSLYKMGSNATKLAAHIAQVATGGADFGASTAIVWGIVIVDQIKKGSEYLQDDYFARKAKKAQKKHELGEGPANKRLRMDAHLAIHALLAAASQTGDQALQALAEKSISRVFQLKIDPKSTLEAQSAARDKMSDILEVSGEPETILDGVESLFDSAGETIGDWADRWQDAKRLGKLRKEADLQKGKERRFERGAFWRFGEFLKGEDAARRRILKELRQTDPDEAAAVDLAMMKATSAREVADLFDALKNRTAAETSKSKLANYIRLHGSKVVPNGGGGMQNCLIISVLDACGLPRELASECKEYLAKHIKGLKPDDPLHVDNKELNLLVQWLKQTQGRNINPVLIQAARNDPPYVYWSPDNGGEDVVIWDQHGHFEYVAGFEHQIAQDQIEKVKHMQLGRGS